MRPFADISSVHWPIIVCLAETLSRNVPLSGGIFPIFDLSRLFSLPLLIERVQYHG